MLSLDFFGPRSYHGEKVLVLVLVDHLSRFMVTASTKSATSELVIRTLLEKWIPSFGIPKVILTDNGSQFTSKEFIHKIKEWGITLARTFVEYPQGNGMNESAHRILKTAIKTTPFAHFNQFDEVLAYATYLYNMTPNRMTGNTPMAIAFGTDVLLPGLAPFSEELTDTARLNLLWNYRGFNIMLSEVNRLEKEVKHEGSTSNKKPIFSVGDIVNYRLSHSERKMAVHLSSEISYQPDRSLPQRVVKLIPSGLRVTPLWTLGGSRDVPRSEVRLLSANIPEELKRQVMELYPFEVGEASR